MILETVAEFGEASPGLVAWELSADPLAVAALFGDAIGQALLALAGEDPAAGEPLFSLTPRGAERLRELQLTEGAAVCATCGGLSRADHTCARCGDVAARPAAPHEIMEVSAEQRLLAAVDHAITNWVSFCRGLAAAGTGFRDSAREQALALERRLLTQESLLRARIRELELTPDCGEAVPQMRDALARLTVMTER